jgi:hypothetical protein
MQTLSNCLITMASPSDRARQDVYSDDESETETLNTGSYDSFLLDAGLQTRAETTSTPASQLRSWQRHRVQTSCQP